MATDSSRFKFTMFGGVGDTLDYRNYKFTKADRILLDKLLTQAVETHRHDGTPGGSTETTPPAGPLVTVQSTGGMIPASTTAYYRIALVDTKGQEHLASQVTAAPTNPPVYAPHPPLLQRGPGVGVLLPGEYLYAVSAYTHENNQETPASRPANSNIDVIGGFSLFPPQPPSGCDGFNVYRKGPTDSELLYVTSIDRDAVGFVDTGAIAANPLRPAPTANTTNAHSSILIDIAGGVPAGQTVKVYRTFNPSIWDNSLLAWTAVLPIIDSGQATQEGTPLSASQAVGSPPKIHLGREAQGSPPPGIVPTTTNLTFAFPGPVDPGGSSWQWISEYDNAIALTYRAALGAGSAPAVRPLRVQLNYRYPIGPWSRYETAYAEIPVGDQMSPRVTLPAIPLARGAAIRPVIVQDGGGATPTDHDLIVTVNLAVRHGSETNTYIWET